MSDAVALSRSVPAVSVDADPSAIRSRGSGLIGQYLSIALRWKWLILAAIASSVLLGMVLTLLAVPQYTATTRLEISREGSRVINVDDVQPENAAGDMEFYQTQYGLLKSASLARRVASKLRLANNAAFFEQFGHDEAAESLAKGGEDAMTPQEREKEVEEILLQQVSVEPQRLSRLVDVRFTSPDPALSARIANTWANEFISFNFERKFEATAYARNFLEGRLASLRKRLEESERELVGYASAQQIINIPVPGTDEDGNSQERSLTADSLAALNRELVEATADRVRAQSRLGGAQGGAVDEALRNQALGELRQRRAEAAAQYAQMMEQFEPEYPPARALAAQISTLDRAIAGEVSRVGASLQKEYNDAVQREQTLSARMDALKGNFLDQRRRGIEYNILQREVDTNRQLYDGLLQRYKEVGVAGAVDANNISVVDAAQVPDKPSSPQPLLNLAASLLIGLVLGIGLALLREQLDESVTDPADVAKEIGLPLLGTVPTADEGAPSEHLADPKSPINEAYFSVVSTLGFTTNHGVPRSLAFTSTRQAEGKSTSAFATAYSLARLGRRVLLIDADMRSPSVHHLIEGDNQAGLSNLLAGTAVVDDVIRASGSWLFDVITAGPPPPNAAELLRGDRIVELLDIFAQRYDHVVLDCPPVMGLADAPVLASHTEATVYVIEAGGVKGRAARFALERLRQSKANLIGIIMTKFDAKRAHYGYGYDYGYSYGSTPGSSCWAGQLSCRRHSTIRSVWLALSSH